MTLKAADILKSNVKLGTLPAVYERLTKVLNNPRSSAADIGKVALEDPGLTVRLLRIVNSPFYGFPSKVETVSHAVTIIGTEQLRDLALATSVVDMFKKVPSKLVTMAEFWKHSLACAVVARGLAVLRRVPNTESFFVAGLLHDIGSLVLYTARPEEAAELLETARKESELVYKVERKLFGFDHASLGRDLLQLWNLPAAQQEAVGCHHRPKAATKFPMEAAVVHVASTITDAFHFGSSGEEYVPPLESAAWDTLNLDPAVVPTLLSDVDQQLGAAIKMFLN